MKRFVIIVIVFLIRHVQADTPWMFQGAVVDGLDNPIEGVLIHVYNGHMGMDKFEVDAESCVTSRCDGSFVGFVSGEHANTYRRVTKGPYVPREDCGTWCTNDVVRLLCKRRFAKDDVERLASTEGLPLYSNVVFLLSHDWSFEEPYCLFPLGSKVRPAVLKALEHPSDHIRTAARRLLRLHIFHPEDMDYTAANGQKRPKEMSTHADIEPVIKEAVAYVSNSAHYLKATTPRRLMNKDGSEALVFFDAFAGVNGHAASFYFHLTKEQSLWRFDYWGISLIE